jgi:hypothetical protein
MKHALYTLFILSTALLLASCSKHEIFNSSPRVVQLSIQGNTTEDLDYIYRDSIVGSTKAGLGGINITLLLAVTGDNAGLSIVRKSTSDTLQQKPITVAPYAQTMSIYYDGTKMYDSSVLLQLKGYALSGQLEFRLDDKVLYTGTGAINTQVAVLIDKNTTRTVKVVKTGETDPLLSKTIAPSPARQTMSFFFDGTKMVENIQLTPPDNPANMMITAKFQSIFAPYFKEVDVDLVFYVKNTATATAVKTSPEIRFTLPSGGSLRSIELPPLPAATGYVYTYDIYEKGTTAIPYTMSVAPFILATFPFQPNEGRYGDFTFEAGASKLWLINDRKNLKTAAPRATYLSGIITDLSQYFQ